MLAGRSYQKRHWVALTLLAACWPAASERPHQLDKLSVAGAPSRGSARARHVVSGDDQRLRRDWHRSHNGARIPHHRKSLASNGHEQEAEGDSVPAHALDNGSASDAESSIAMADFDVINDRDALMFDSRKRGVVDRQREIPLDTTAKSAEEMLLAVGGGTGASVGGRQGDLMQDRETLMSMRYQDEAVFLLLVLVYFATLCFSASFAYRQVANNSPITFYADPRTSNLAIDSHSTEDFLEEFTRPPEEVRMQVTGFVPVAVADLGMHSFEWREQTYSVAFSFTLDLSPWVKKVTGEHGQMLGTPPVAATADGVALEDLCNLSAFLAEDAHDLCQMDVVKNITWPKWEDLATNIKHRVRQEGFRGILDVNRGNIEELSVYKNKHWANFMYSRTFKVLCALSLFAWPLYDLYMRWKTNKYVLRCYHTVDISIEEYWTYVETHLRANGFDTHASGDSDLLSMPLYPSRDGFSTTAQWAAEPSGRT